MDHGRRSMYPMYSSSSRGDGMGTGEASMARPMSRENSGTPIERNPLMTLRRIGANLCTTVFDVISARSREELRF